MMKRVLYYMILSLLLVGCSEEANQQQDELLPTGDVVTFSSDIVSMQNGTADSGWDNDDRIGVYMLKQGTTSVINNSRNRQYAVSDGTKFTAAPKDEVYYLANGQKVDFIAYYPYQSTLVNYTYRIDVANQSAPHDIDLLYSGNVQGVSNGENTLTFEHKLSLLSFSISAGDGLSTSDLASMQMSLKGINSVADFNLLTYNISNESHKANVLALTASNGESSQAIIIPSTLALELEFVLANGIKFEWKADNATRFYQGTEYKLNVIVGASGVEITLTGINDWGGADRDPIEGEGELVTPPVVQTYAVGDLYPDDVTPVGVVFEISNGGTNGKVVGFVESQQRWGDNTKDESADGVLLIRDDYNGSGATKNLITKRKVQPNFAKDYFIFNWIYNTLNVAEVEGNWYLPSKHELMSLYAGISGLTFTDVASGWSTGGAMPNFSSTQSARDAFNAKIKAASGTELNFYGQYWSSTEISANAVWSIHFQTSVLQNGKSKGDTFGRARPILAF